MMRALVIGISGMDGSHLADLLVQKGYEVHGIVRRHARPDHRNIQHLIEKDAITLHEADLTDQNSLNEVVHAVRPEEVYNLAAQSHVGTSYKQADLTLNVTGLGALRLFEAVRHHAPQARVYQASSSEQFGNAGEDPRVRLVETSPMMPVSPYGVAKLAAHQLAAVYRKAYHMNISCGILFNHEGPRRGPLFVTRKITLGLARLRWNEKEKLKLGNLSAQRDWGYAPEYVEGMKRMLEHDEPGDWVLATGEVHSVQEFLQEALKTAGEDLAARVESVPEQARPTDIHRLVGNPERAKVELGWEARTKFRRLVKLMMEHDMGVE